MSMNKKRIVVFSVILLIAILPFFVDASVLTGTASYVGENICDEDSMQTVLRLVGVLLIIVKMLVPLILVVMGTIDLAKAVIGKDEKELGKSLKTFMLRIALGIFIFFIPSLVNWAFSVFNEYSDGDASVNKCVTCVLDPGNC